MDDAKRTLKKTNDRIRAERVTPSTPTGASTAVKRRRLCAVLVVARRRARRWERWAATKGDATAIRYLKKKQKKTNSVRQLDGSAPPVAVGAVGRDLRATAALVSTHSKASQTQSNPVKPSQTQSNPVKPSHNLVKHSKTQSNPVKPSQTQSKPSKTQ